MNATLEQIAREALLLPHVEQLARALGGATVDKGGSEPKSDTNPLGSLDLRKLQIQEAGKAIGLTPMAQRAIDITKLPSTYSCTFGFFLKVSDLTIPCNKILWEQWITGGLKYKFADGTSSYEPAGNWVKHKEARKAGPWCEDLLGLQKPGPRGIKPEYGAKCGGEPDKVLYIFADEPGTFHNVGDTIGDKRIDAVTFDIGICHKLWDARWDTMFFERVFYLRGKRTWAVDTTRIDL